MRAGLNSRLSWNGLRARCVSLLVMRRVKAILVIVALLSAPLAVLAQTSSEDMPSCGGMCCLPHHAAHNPASHHASAATQEHQSTSCARPRRADAELCVQLRRHARGPLFCVSAGTDQSFESRTHRETRSAEGGQVSFGING